MAEGLEKGTRLRADKGFFSADNKAMLKRKGLKCESRAKLRS